jgi:hypothetical protein
MLNAARKHWDVQASHKERWTGVRDNQGAKIKKLGI